MQDRKYLVNYFQANASRNCLRKGIRTFCQRPQGPEENMSSIVFEADRNCLEALHAYVGNLARNPQDPGISRAPQGNERGAMGSKSHPAYWNPCFSLLSTVLRTLVSF